MTHLALARPWQDDDLTGYQAACECGWEGRTWSGTTEARTTAYLAAQRHVCDCEVAA